jgi:hypothetical protein
MESGQITIAHEGGRLLRAYAGLPDVHTIVEIGTWNGMGSTRCLLGGMATRPPGDCTLWSYEVCREMHARALANNPDLAPNIRLIWGRLTKDLVHPDEFADEFFLDYSRDDKFVWYNQDRSAIEGARDVFDTLPPHIDLLVLDGGEFSTWHEWRLLRHRFTYCFLDDTRQIKCARIVEEVRDRPDMYRVVWEAQEGNGRMLIQRTAV